MLMPWLLDGVVPAMFAFFFFKQKTAYEITEGDWSSDVCSSDLGDHGPCGARWRGSGVHVGGPRRAAPRERGARARAGRLVPAVPRLLPLLSSSAAATSGTRGAHRRVAYVAVPITLGYGTLAFGGAAGSFSRSRLPFEVSSWGSTL